MKRLLYVLILLLSPLLLAQGYTNAGGGSVPAGNGTGFLSVGGILCKGAPAQATTGTVEEVLATCTIPANTLTNNGAKLTVSYFAHAAANANNKTLKIRVGGIGGVVVLDSSALAANNLNFVNAGGDIARLSATAATVKFIGWTASNATPSVLTANLYSFLRSVAITWANSNDLVITGTTPTAAGDLTLDTYSVEVVQ